MKGREVLRLEEFKGKYRTVKETDYSVTLADKDGKQVLVYESYMWRENGSKDKEFN